jgi:hypothetical protein
MENGGRFESSTKASCMPADHAYGADEMIDGGPLFDRRVPDALMETLGSEGAFSWVAEHARRPLEPGFALDLGLRASPKSPHIGRATLYLGTTQVLGVHLSGRDLFHLTPHKKNGLFKPVDPPFDEGWRKVRQPLSGFTESMPMIQEHVDAAIAAAPAGRQSEGFYQAALAKPTDAGFTLIDREVTFPFSDTPLKKQRIEELRRPLVEVKDRLARANRWRATKDPGDKIDALAIHRDGRLLAIEVKPGPLVGPANLFQLAMYVRLLRAWIEPDKAFARQVIEGMARQRAALGLGSREQQQLSATIEVVPVLAIGKPMDDREDVRERFEIVLDALNEAGEPLCGLLSGLRFCAIEESGEVSIIDASELDEGFD